LSLLVFSQARELKRLREWAGRAPERATELEQRVSAEAAARVQRVVQPAVPRATPVVTRAAAPPAPGGPPAAAAGGTAASAGSPPASQPQPGQPAFVPTPQADTAAAGAPGADAQQPG